MVMAVSHFHCLTPKTILFLIYPKTPSKLLEKKMAPLMPQIKFYFMVLAPLGMIKKMTRTSTPIVIRHIIILRMGELQA
jgi:hypothetical protein